MQLAKILQFIYVQNLKSIMNIFNINEQLQSLNVYLKVNVFDLPVFQCPSYFAR